MSNHRLLVDYLALSFKDVCYFDLLREALCLPLSEFIECPSKRNYACCVVFGDCVYLHYTPENLSADESRHFNPGCFIECSGQGCRQIESWRPDFDWFLFLHGFDREFREMSSLGSTVAHLARLDVACDLLDSETIDMNFIDSYVQGFKFVTKCKRRNISGVYNYSYHRMETIYFGNRRSRSDRLFRIYDKAIEQNLPDAVKWIRFEFELRNDCALSFYLNLCENKGDWGAVYYGVLYNYLRFVETDAREVKDYSRLATADWWSDFCHGVSGLPQLYLPGIPYTGEMLKRYVHTNLASSLRAYSIYNEGDFSVLKKHIENAGLNRRQYDMLVREGKKIGIQFLSDSAL